MTQRSVLVVLFDDLQSLDVTGPVEVFAGADRAVGRAYEIRTASLDGAPVRTSSGLTLVPDSSLAEAAVPHTLIVPGGPGTPYPRRPPDRLVAHPCAARRAPGLDL
jgi:transcriptional regulator GlxA family with amidase domain